MPRAPKPCGRLDCPVRVVGRTYCPEHSKRPASPSSIAARDNRERSRRKEAVDAWVARHGYNCPGWEREPHESMDLTAAHHVAVARGGVSSRLGVLCRSCNSRQALSLG